MLKLDALHYRHGAREVLAGIDLRVAAGEVVALLGPNGAGKSTLLRCINQTAGPYRGRITLDGHDARLMGRRELARRVSWVPQQGGSSMALRVVDMVLLGRAPHRRPGSGRRDMQVVFDIIERLQLQHLATRAVDRLSGGERQRVMLARAIAQESSLVLLDEPTSELDLRHQLETMALVRETARERNVAVLVAIHDLALAARLADRLVLLSEGRIHADGAWQQVLSTENLRAVYGVEAIVGSHGELPYVMAVAGRT
ncbi:ABC transporter ATP-binding protein [Herbaspirillum sp. YR522]|uniref:ABC transporter ATP-binding protein n=1 Tax=Herbaspirillum sp. YR522 TaxID=1144342 RepID=UPI00026FCDE3|nr:ABC transporter ATP-binding protein [Herbaspirillum sp. YR522]EJM95640.1 ABC-type cobalamin/Fe3+-siderophore transport system, ATPase component [Herbaspirillum sp. YR522]